MQEKEFEQLTEEEMDDIMTKACLMLLENPKLVIFRKGEYICIPDAPYEIRFFVKAKNSRSAFMKNYAK